MKSSLCSFAMICLLAAETAGEGLTGQQLVAQAATRIAAEPAIAAEMRYRIDAFERQVTGTGRYLQLASGPERLLRLDLRMQAGDQPATLLEVRGPDFFWVRREVPPAAP